MEETMKRLILLVFAALLFSAAGRPHAMYRYETERADVRAADDAFVQAVLRSDPDRLKKLLDDDFSWTGTKGEVFRRDGLLAEVPRDSGISQDGREFRVFSG